MKRKTRDRRSLNGIVLLSLWGRPQLSGFIRTKNSRYLLESDFVPFFPHSRWPGRLFSSISNKVPRNSFFE